MVIAILIDAENRYRQECSQNGVVVLYYRNPHFMKQTPL